MIKNKSSSTKVNLNANIHEKMTVGEFLKRTKEDPWSIIHDFDVRYAIEELRRYCKDGIERKSKGARTILDLAGLKAFIPKDSHKRKTNNPALRHWQKSSYILVQYIVHLENEMKPFWERGRTRTEKRTNSIQHLLGRPPTNEEWRELTHGERDIDLTHLALSIFAASRDIPFESLKNYITAKK